MDASDDVNDELLIDNILNFLLFYNWLFCFKWIGEFYEVGEKLFKCKVIDNMPCDWVNTLIFASQADLQAFVNHNYCQLSDWSADLLKFASNCTNFTRRLSKLIMCPVKCSNQFGGLNFNSTASCIDFVIQNDHLLKQMDKNQFFLKMNPKKIYEVKNMAIFVDAVCSTKEHVRTTENFKVVSADDSVGTFQTVSLMKANSGLSNLSTLYSYTPLAIADIGSGLGHLTNLIAQLKLNRYFGKDKCHSTDIGKIVAIERDLNLHDRSVQHLKLCSNKALNNISTECVIERLCFNVEMSTLNELREKLGQYSELSKGYLLSGLHCCGDLTNTMIQLFKQDSLAKTLVLVGCCYHKMSKDKYPQSDFLKRKLIDRPELVNLLAYEASLRLACQNSPSTWFRWTEKDGNIHRSQMLLRIIFDLLCRQLKADSNITRSKLRHLLNPAKDEAFVHLIQMQSIEFEQVFDVLYEFCRRIIVSTLNADNVPDKNQFDAQYFVALKQIWLFIPGVLALQHLLQPLLEILILADRFWYLKEANDDQDYLLDFVGYVRLFDPVISPRCMALVAHKK